LLNYPAIGDWHPRDEIQPRRAARTACPASRYKSDVPQSGIHGMLTMTVFADQLMIRYMDLATVDLLLVPQGDTTMQRAQALLASVYEPRLLTVQSVDTITVTAKSFQVPIVEPMTVSGTWERVIPQSERSLISFSLPAIAQTDWIDMARETTVSVRVSGNSEPLNMVTSEDVSELSEQDFLAKFQFLDLASLMTAARVSTYQELQADFPRLYHLHCAAPPPYNPNDPNAKRTYRLRVYVVFFSTLNVQGALRQVPQSRRAMDAVWPQPSENEGGDLLAAGAWIGVFPTSVFDPATTSITQADVSALSAAQGWVAARIHARPHHDRHANDQRFAAARVFVLVTADELHPGVFAREEPSSDRSQRGRGVRLRPDAGRRTGSVRLVPAGHRGRFPGRGARHP
jgi:hypothetical protein